MKTASDLILRRIRGTCKDIGDELYRRAFAEYEDPDPRNLVFLTALGNLLEND